MHLRRISIEPQESRPRWRLRVASTNPPMFDMIREFRGPCSDLVWMCEREALPFSKPLVVGEKKINNLALFDVYDSVHDFSIGDPGLARVGIRKPLSRLAPNVNPFPSSPLTAKGSPRTPSLRTKTPLHAVFTSRLYLASFLPRSEFTDCVVCNSRSITLAQLSDQSI